MAWNSTVNLKGGDGRNLEGDLYNEFYNGFLSGKVTVNCSPKGRKVLLRFSFLFSVNVLDVQSQNTESMSRRSQAFPIAQELVDDVLHELKDDEETSVTRSKDYQKWSDDITKAVEMLLENNVFLDIGKRSHLGFENFIFKTPFVEDIAGYKTKIKKLSSRLDVMQKCRDLDFEP